MMHLWLRAETRANEMRTPLTPEGAAKLISLGYQVSVEKSETRIIPDAAYDAAGCAMVEHSSWHHAPSDAVILGLKELPENGPDLRHRHIMFGHAYKGQPAGQRLLQRFAAGGGQLLDLEYLLDDRGRRLAAFGYWAGYAGAAVSLLVWAAQQKGEDCHPFAAYPARADLQNEVKSALREVSTLPSAIVIGALGRVGTGAGDLCQEVGVKVTRWDMPETARGGPFPEILTHSIFLNCILAQDGTPPFVEKSMLGEMRNLGVIGDIACDPESSFNPIPIYDRVTSWDQPAVRISEDPVLDVVAIDNLPSLLPLESSIDFADQLLSCLETVHDADDPVWARASDYFHAHVQKLLGA